MVFSDLWERLVRGDFRGKYCGSDITGWCQLDGLRPPQRPVLEIRDLRERVVRGGSHFFFRDGGDITGRG